MTEPAFATVSYNEQDQQVSWRGVIMDDDHLPPGHGVLDFDSFATALDDIEFGGAWTLEVLALNHPGSVEDVAIELADIRDRWESEGMGNIR